MDLTQLLNNHDILLDYLNSKVAVPGIVFEQVLVAWDYRPQVRMVQKFGDGRVFLTGGECIIFFNDFR